MDHNGNDEYYGSTTGNRSREFHTVTMNSNGDNEDNDNNSSTGRWTDEEHEAFLQGLRMHGRNWKQVATFIPSRTIVQIRTHAQKYFAKLTKAGVPFDERGSLEDGGNTTIPSASIELLLGGSLSSSPHHNTAGGSSNVGNNGNIHSSHSNLNKEVSSSLNEFLISSSSSSSSSGSHPSTLSLQQSKQVTNHSTAITNKGISLRSSAHSVPTSASSIKFTLSGNTTTNSSKNTKNYSELSKSLRYSNDNGNNYTEEENESLVSRRIHGSTSLSPSLYNTGTGTDEDYSDTNHPYPDASIDESDSEDEDSDSDDDDNNNDDNEGISPMRNRLFSASHPTYNESTGMLDHHGNAENNNTVVRVKVRRGSGNLSITSANELVSLQDMDSAILLENDSVGDLDFADRLMVFSDTSAPPTPIMTSMNSRLQRLSGSPILGPTSPLSISGRKRSGSGFTNMNASSTTTTSTANTSSPRMQLSSLNPPTARLVRSLSGPSTTSTASLHPSFNNASRVPTLTKQHSLSKLISIEMNNSNSASPFALPPASLTTAKLTPTSLFTSTPPLVGLTNETGILSSKSSSSALTSTFRFLNENNEISRSTSPDLAHGHSQHPNHGLGDDLNSSNISNNNSYISHDISLPSFSMISSFGISTIDNHSLGLSHQQDHNMENTLLGSTIRSSSLLEAEHQHDDNTHIDNENIILSLQSSPSGNRHLPLVPPPTQHRTVSHYNNTELVTDTNHSHVNMGVPMNKLANALLRLPRNEPPSDNTKEMPYVTVQPFSHPQESHPSTSRSSNSPSTASHSARSVSPVPSRTQSTGIVSNNGIINGSSNGTGENVPLASNLPHTTTTVRSRSKSSSRTSADLSSSSSSPSRYTSQTTVYSLTNHTAHSTTASEGDMDGEENSFGGSSDNHTSSISLASGGISHRSSFDGSSPRRNQRSIVSGTVTSNNHTVNNNNHHHRLLPPVTGNSTPIIDINRLTPGNIHVPPPSSGFMDNSSYRVGNVRIAAIVTTQIYSPIVTELADDALEELVNTNNFLLQNAMALNRPQPLAPSQCTLVTRTILDTVTKQPATTVSIIPTTNLHEEQRKDKTMVPFTGTGICVGAVPVQLPHGPIQFVRVPIPDQLQPQVPDCNDNITINSSVERKDTTNGKKQETEHGKHGAVVSQYGGSFGGSKMHPIPTATNVNVFDPDAFFS